LFAEKVREFLFRGVISLFVIRGRCHA
jgi:hypothetical protein